MIIFDMVLDPFIAKLKVEKFADVTSMRKKAIKQISSARRSAEMSI